MGIVLGFIVTVFVVVCVLLVVIILLQDSKGEGLSSSAFGGEGLQSVLGGHGAATFLSRATAWLAGSFLLISLLLMKFYGDTTGGQLSPIGDETEKSSVQSVSPETETEETVDQSDQASDQKTPAVETNQTDATKDIKTNAETTGDAGFDF
ncbi:MAG: preprotein translocase subunit SecG [Candidatus Poribacteria bacterium]